MTRYKMDCKTLDYVLTHTIFVVSYHMTTIEHMLTLKLVKIKVRRVINYILRSTLLVRRYFLQTSKTTLP
jgi:lipid A disaccharide synthetase